MTDDARPRPEGATLTVRHAGHVALVWRSSTHPHYLWAEVDGAASYFLASGQLTQARARALAEELLEKQGRAGQEQTL